MNLKVSEKIMIFNNDLVCCDHHYFKGCFLLLVSSYSAFVCFVKVSLLLKEQSDLSKVITQREQLASLFHEIRHRLLLD